MSNDQITMKLCESMIKKGTWKVWIKGPHSSGFLRMGFAWKTRLGAERAASAKYPGANFIS